MCKDMEVELKFKVGIEKGNYFDLAVSVLIMTVAAKCVQFKLMFFKSI
jgi:hypothetical protein